MNDYSKIPDHCREGMRNYIENRYPVGDFLYYALCNDLVHAHSHADEINRHRLGDYAQFLYWEAPSACWGSPEKVKNWLEPK